MDRRLKKLKPEFVDFMPDDLRPGVLYVSVQFKSIQHLCCCGCGRKVVTPLSPTGWRMEFDGRTISLSPSIGNWQKDCRSHYFIVENRVRWAPRWSEREIARGLRNDVQSKLEYYSESTPKPSEAAHATTQENESQQQRSFVAEGWRRLKRKLRLSR